MPVLAKTLIANDNHSSPYRGIASFNDLAGSWPVAEKSFNRPKNITAPQDRERNPSMRSQERSNSKAWTIVRLGRRSSAAALACFSSACRTTRPHKRSACGPGTGSHRQIMVASETQWRAGVAIGGFYLGMVVTK